MKRRKLLARLAAGSVRNVAFDDFAALVSAFGFVEVRQSGSHHIFSRPDVPQLVNLQDVNGEAIPDSAVPPVGGTLQPDNGGRA